MNTILFLDLENTVIWDWTENPTLMCARFPILKEWVVSHLGPNTRVGLLSWAVWHEADLEEFNKDGGIRMDLEITHKFKFDDSLIIKLNDCIDKARNWMKMPKLDQTDFFEFIKKRQMMEEIWLHEFDQPNTNVILFDDTVPNITLRRDDVENNTLQFVDPWTIIKRDFI